MVVAYGSGILALVEPLDGTTRADILDDCIDLHLEEIRRRRQAALKARLRQYTGAT